MAKTQNKASQRGAASRTSTTPPSAPKAAPALAFSRLNYLLLIAGVLVIVIGFGVMASETAQYGFGPLGLTVGPILILVGFLIVLAAILVSGNKNTSEEASNA